MRYQDYERTTDSDRAEQAQWEAEHEPARPCGAVAVLLAFAALFGLAMGILIVLVS